MHIDVSVQCELLMNFGTCSGYIFETYSKHSRNINKIG